MAKTVMNQTARMNQGQMNKKMKGPDGPLPGPGMRPMMPPIRGPGPPPGAMGGPPGGMPPMGPDDMPPNSLAECSTSETAPTLSGKKRYFIMYSKCKTAN